MFRVRLPPRDYSNEVQNRQLLHGVVYVVGAERAGVTVLVEDPEAPGPPHHRTTSRVRLSLISKQ